MFGPLELILYYIIMSHDNEQNNVYIDTSIIDHYNSFSVSSIQDWYNVYLWCPNLEYYNGFLDSAKLRPM
jgi:hypothetical protein